MLESGGGSDDGAPWPSSHQPPPPPLRTTAATAAADGVLVSRGRRCRSRRLAGSAGTSTSLKMRERATQMRSTRGDSPKP